VPERTVTLVAGARSREKIVSVEGIELGEVERRLDAGRRASVERSE
jgi:uncharacterized protein YggU (UPF0235/DUF167 family)